MNKPNITPDVFRVILKFMYTGTIVMSDNMLSYYLDILIAADELALIELIDYLVEYILKKETFWFRRNLVKIHRISSQHEAFHKLKTTCEEIIQKDSSTFLRSKDIGNLEESINNEDDTGICSRVKNNVNKVGCAGQEKLPWFGNDLNWIKGVCKQQIYEKQIVDFEKFNSEDVEVYKVLLKVNNNNIFFDEYNDDHTTIFNSEIIEY
ncbi:unnamed protein product [Rhizophagus irregularis]|uniref:BTB domain-containing protein n=1 Tax=Rhizophagus irregularis TaxID=588596 RepID=A0A915ZDZ5_9GLOM|nr:unnamed protein product [Rhizophagus irregularis]CAB5372429.1 unnamed protein product [Rhizophagus irregularis]